MHAERERDPIPSPLAVSNHVDKFLHGTPAPHVYKHVQRLQPRDPVPTSLVLSRILIIAGIENLRELNDQYGLSAQVHPGQEMLGGQLERVVGDGQKVAQANLQALRQGYAAIVTGFLYNVFYKLAQSPIHGSNRNTFAREYNAVLKIAPPSFRGELSKNLPVSDEQNLRGQTEIISDQDWSFLHTFFKEHGEIANFFGEEQWKLVPSYLRAFAKNSGVEHVIFDEIAPDFLALLTRVRYVEIPEMVREGMKSSKLSLKVSGILHRLSGKGKNHQEPVHTVKSSVSILDKISQDPELSAILDAFNRDTS